jgi:hypothetical protein
MLLQWTKGHVMVFVASHPNMWDCHADAKTFLMQAGSFYHQVIEILFGRLTTPFYQQVNIL